MPPVSEQQDTRFGFFYAPSVVSEQALRDAIAIFEETGLKLTGLVLDVVDKRLDFQATLPAKFAFEGPILHASVAMEGPRSLHFEVWPDQHRLEVSGHNWSLAIYNETRATLEAHFPPASTLPLALERQQQVDAHIASLEASDARYLDQLDSRDALSAKMFADHEDRMAELEDSYRQRMQLKAPVEYWEERVKDLSKVASARLWRLGTGVALGLTGLVALAGNLMGEYGDTTPPAWLLALALIGISIGVWVVRLFSTAYFSALHLTEDARFRAQVTKGYLALVDADAADADNRAPVLDHLFRPVSYGLLKNEGPPLGILDVVRRLGKD